MSSPYNALPAFHIELSINQMREATGETPPGGYGSARWPTLNEP